jgi:superfamily II DNA helicase RecQ
MHLMGYDSLRAGQDRVVSTIMAGRDCVVVLPTSTGKTAAMVLPVLALGKCALIFSPLISLMQDQVQSLRKKGVRAGCLNSHNGAFNSEYLKDWVAGKLDVLIVAPERLRKEEFMAAMRHRRPWMVAVDECFTPETEVLTEHGFVRFDAYKEGQKVAQFDQHTGQITFVVPDAVICKPYSGDMVRLHSKHQCDLTMTPGHELLIQRKGAWRKEAVASADLGGTLMATAGFGLGNDDFLKREEYLEVNRAVTGKGKSLRETLCLDGMGKTRARDLIDSAVTHRFSRESYGVQRCEFRAEDDADFMQAVCVLAGYRSEKTTEGEDEVTHVLSVDTKTHLIPAGALHKEAVPYTGNVHCVRVPTGAIVVRGKGKPVVIGNCHCLSAWSMTFRSAYCIVGDFITDVNPDVVVALTATCPPEVEKDIRRVMCIEQALKVVHYPRRENLDLKSEDWPDMLGLHRAIEKVNGVCIVYCATQKHTEEYAYQLGQLSGTEVGFYHGGMSADKRANTQRQFMQGEINLMCATNAFGMGVDKDCVRGVFHADFPGTIENYSQETGRGGRDGKYTLCMSYYSPGAHNTQRFLINCSNPSESDVRSMFKAITRLAGSSDTVHMSVDKIAEAARIKNINSSYACMQVLQGSLVVDRTKAESKMCSVRFKNHVDDVRFIETKQAIVTLGDRKPDGYHNFDLLQLAVELDRNEAGVRTYLNKLTKESSIDFVPPERAAPTRIIGDDSLVDYEAVTRRREDAEAKLAEVVHFLQEVPDDEKHGYLERYFGVTNEHTK